MTRYKTKHTRRHRKSTRKQVEGMCAQRACTGITRQFVRMWAMQVYEYGQIWCCRGASGCICHGSMSNALPLCRPNIGFVWLLARCNLLGALGASAGRRRRVVGDVVIVHASLPVPCQSAAVQSRRPYTRLKRALLQKSCITGHRRNATYNNGGSCP